MKFLDHHIFHIIWLISSKTENFGVLIQDQWSQIMFSFISYQSAGIISACHQAQPELSSWTHPQWSKSRTHHHRWVLGRLFQLQALPKVCKRSGWNLWRALRGDGTALLPSPTLYPRGGSGVSRTFLTAASQHLTGPDSSKPIKKDLIWFLHLWRNGCQIHTKSQVTATEGPWLLPAVTLFLYESIEIQGRK